MRILVSIGLLALVSACSGTKPPPSADGAQRVTLNTAGGISSLQQEAIERDAKIDAVASSRVTPPLIVERVTVYFPYNDTVFAPTQADADVLARWANKASRIVIRGRTDAEAISKGDAEIAKGRATSARHYLLNIGARADVMTVNYQSAADHVSLGKSPEARAMNRRVDIEITHQ